MNVYDDPRIKALLEKWPLPNDAESIRDDLMAKLKNEDETLSENLELKKQELKNLTETFCKSYCELFGFVYDIPHETTYRLKGSFPHPAGTVYYYTSWFPRKDSAVAKVEEIAKQEENLEAKEMAKQLLELYSEIKAIQNAKGQIQNENVKLCKIFGHNFGPDNEYARCRFCGSWQPVKHEIWDLGLD